MRVAAAVLLLFVLCALPAQAQTGADVTFVIVPPDGGEQKTVTLSALGAPDRPEGHSLSQLLRHAGIADGRYDEVEVAQAGGPVRIVRGEIRLTELREVPSDRARDPKASLSERTWTRAFPRATPVLLRSDAAGVTIVRPQFFTQAATTLRPVDGVFTLTVTAKANVEASSTTPRSGEAVSFVATPPTGVDRAALTYRWDFGDRTVEDGGAEISHAYATAKTLNVTVTFLQNGTPSGEAFVTVFVADPLRSGSAGDRRRPVRRGPRGRESDNRGESDGGGGANGDRGQGSGDGTGDPGGDLGGEQLDPVAPPPVDAYDAPAETPPPVAEPEPAPAPEPQPEPEPRRAEPRRAQPQPEPAGETVSGYLLASTAGGGPDGSGGDAGELPEDAPEQLKQLAEPNEAATSGRSLPTIALVVGGLLALLALGWALEGRRTLPYWQP